MTTIERHRHGPVTDLWWPFEARPFEALVASRLHDEAAMRVEEFVDGEDLVVRAELPGLDPDKDVTVTVADGHLTIAAERRDEHTEGERGTAGFRSEFRYGSFRRRLLLPPGVGADQVTATYRDGILEVRMPAKGPRPAPAPVPVTRT